MVNEFLLGSSTEYAVSNIQMVTRNKIPLTKACNRLMRLQISLSQPINETLSSAMATVGVWQASARGRCIVD